MTTLQHLVCPEDARWLDTCLVLPVMQQHMLESLVLANQWLTVCIGSSTINDNM